MKNENIGAFLKKLRVDANYTQKDLAEKMYVSSSKITRLENSQRMPSLDDLILYAQIFRVSLDEIVAGEKRTNKNSQRLYTTFLTYLSQQNTRIKRFKVICLFFLCFFFLLFLGMATLYFFQNYKTIQVYHFSGSSEHYEVLDGLLVLTKDKSYFQIEEIAPEVKEIEIVTKINDQEKKVYTGPPNSIIEDRYGYNAFISYDDFINGNQEIYILLDQEKIELHFTNAFTNDKFVYNRVESIGDSVNDYSSFVIPDKVRQLFSCEGDICSLENNGIFLTFNLGVFYVQEQEKSYTYDLVQNSFSYQNKNKQGEVLFTIQNDNVECVVGNCENALLIYNDFLENYVKKYLE